MRLVFLFLFISSYGMNVVKTNEDFTDVVGAAVAGVVVDQTAGRAADAFENKISNSDMKMPGWINDILDIVTFMIICLMIILIGASFVTAPLQTTAFIASQYASKQLRKSH
jgi:hypothetical protein